jgi:hypothetical protein
MKSFPSHDQAGAVDPCVYSGSGDFEVDCSEGCDFSETDLLGNDFIMKGPGTVTGLRNVKNYGTRKRYNGCISYI